MDNQQHYKAVIKMSSSSETKQIQIPSNLDLEGGKFFISNIAGKLTTGAAKYIHIESSSLSNEFIYVTETNGYNVLASCMISNVVSNNIFENTIASVGFPIPLQFTNSARVDFQVTDENHLLLTTLEFLEITLVFICNKKVY